MLPKFRVSRWTLCACLSGMALWVSTLAGIERAHAHEIRPAIASANFLLDGRFEIVISLNMEALVAGVGPQHKDTSDSPSAAAYNQLRALPPDALTKRIEEFAPRFLAGIRIEFDRQQVTPRIASIEVPPVGDTALARLTIVRLDGQVPTGARSLRWHYAAEFGSSVLRVKRAGSNEIVASWLKDGKVSDDIPLGGAAARSTADIFAEYVAIGFSHILPQGLDHILFVLGLFLLSTQWRPLLVQVTAFTVAHSITLGLGLYGVVSVSPAIVEPLIAVSIVYVAVENIVTSKLNVWRPFVVFGFGLLHGLGFAGVLREIGLPRADYLTGLVAFNLGVEFGQLAVIAIAFALTGLWFRAKPWYRKAIVVPASAAIALMGLFWTVERVFFV
jgi:hypothetical protein